MQPYMPSSIYVTPSTMALHFTLQHNHLQRVTFIFPSTMILKPTQMPFHHPPSNMIHSPPTLMLAGEVNLEMLNTLMQKLNYSNFVPCRVTLYSELAAPLLGNQFGNNVPVVPHAKQKLGQQMNVQKRSYPSVFGV